MKKENNINTEHLDNEIRHMDAIAQDKTNQPRLRLIALSKKAKLLATKAELLSTKMVNDLSEIDLGANVKIGNRYL